MDGEEEQHFPDALRVMVIDDDQIFLKEAWMQFSSCNYRVETCESPLFALEILRERACDFDFLLVNLHMLEIDDFELLKIVKEELNLPIITMSSDGGVDLMRKSHELGACFFLKKPLDISIVNNLWQYLIPKKRYRNRRKSVGSSSKETNLEDYQIEINTSSKEKCELNDKGNAKQDISNARKMKEVACPKCSKCKCDKGRNDKKLCEDEEHNQPKQHIMWDAFLDNRFTEALRILGEDAVPSKILQIMDVQGLKRKHVSSHLQKYRLRKRKEAVESSASSSTLPTHPTVNYNQLLLNAKHNSYGQPSYLSNYYQQNPNPMTQINQLSLRPTLPPMFNTDTYKNINNIGSYSNHIHLSWNVMANPTHGAQNFCKDNAPLPFIYGEQNNFAATQQDTRINTEQLVENSSKIVGEEDFNNMIEKFAYGDDPWPLIPQDALNHDLDLNLIDDLMDDK